MRSLAIAAFLVLFPLSAWSLDIKGVALGATEGDVSAAYGKRWSCVGDAGEERTCRKSLDPHDVPIVENDSYANEHAQIRYTFGPDGKLVHISVRGLGSETFDVIRKALEDKFGKPSNVTDSDVQNGVGNTFRNTTVTWSTDDAELILSRYSYRLDKAALELIDPKYREKNASDEVQRARDNI
jgi:hypothetical protein